MKKLPRPRREAPATRLPKRERTRRQIIEAAIEVMAEQGPAKASVQEIAARAKVTTGTFYNHFTSKAEIVEAVAGWFSTTMLEAAQDAHLAFHTGAERMVDGCRRYLRIARENPPTAMLILELATTSPRMLKAIGKFVLADVRLGIRQKEFAIFSEQAAVDLVHGYIMLAMRHIALRQPSSSYERSVVATILQGLGVPSQRALALAGRGTGRGNS
ncbi:TetR/AcrR family transcriptional regulator [Reyranella sp.]|uniref:TetR/AcrR family transcriptional regulator n=1 Tax=Reyranella sp. TaxID=1929291 RepID=UPI0025F37183|nr:TetR/AcrR family transcriptional regulator [Reyranella sp.]